MVFRNSDLVDIIDRFVGHKVLVLGESMLDTYLKGSSERLCQEAPVPIVDVREISYLPGGAANTAVNLSSLGAQVTFLSVIGQDEAGFHLLQSLEGHNINTRHLLKASTRTTLTKQRILAEGQILVRFDQGSTADLDPETETELLDRLRQLFHDCEALVISDYRYGVITDRIIEALATLQRNAPRVIVVDSKRLPAYRTLNMTAAKLNYEESTHLLGIESIHRQDARLQQVATQGRKVLDLTGAQMAAITLDHNGALIFHREHEVPYRTYAEPRPDSQAAGAGDTFTSALTMSLVTGIPVEQAAEIASAAASVVVSKSGTAVCFLEELKEFFSATEKFVEDVFQLALRLALYRKTKRKIVFTNGCFDILHRGHIAYLNRAKALGDILIVGLNSDRSVRKLKGAERPINSLEDRAQVLAALSCIDHIVPLEEDTPHELIRRIVPDIFVKGGDYTRATLPEAGLVEELGGRVEILPYLESYSTTNVIAKLSHLATERPVGGKT